MPRFFIKNKFLRLLANIVCICLWWMLVNLILAQFSPGSMDLSFLGPVDSYEQAMNRTVVASLILVALYGSIMLVPPFWLTWYLWIRKRGPKMQ